MRQGAVDVVLLRLSSQCYASVDSDGAGCASADIDDKLSETQTQGVLVTCGYISIDEIAPIWLLLGRFGRLDC